MVATMMSTRWRRVRVDEAIGRTEWLRDIRCESPSHGVLRDDAWLHELKEVVRAAGFGAYARHEKSAERLPLDERPRYPPINVEISDAVLLFGSLEVLWMPREYAPGEGVLRGCRELDRVLEIFGMSARDYRPKDLIGPDRVCWRDISKDRGSDVVAALGELARDLGLS